MDKVGVDSLWEFATEDLSKAEGQDAWTNSDLWKTLTSVWLEKVKSAYKSLPVRQSGENCACQQFLEECYLSLVEKWVLIY